MLRSKPNEQKTLANSLVAMKAVKGIQAINAADRVKHIQEQAKKKFQQAYSDHLKQAEDKEEVPEVLFFNRKLTNDELTIAINNAADYLHQKMQVTTVKLTPWQRFKAKVSKDYQKQLEAIPAVDDMRKFLQEFAPVFRKTNVGYSLIISMLNYLDKYLAAGETGNILDQYNVRLLVPASIMIAQQFDDAPFPFSDLANCAAIPDQKKNIRAMMYSVLSAIDYETNISKECFQTYEKILAVTPHQETSEAIKTASAKVVKDCEKLMTMVAVADKLTDCKDAAAAVTKMANELTHEGKTEIAAELKKYENLTADQIAAGIEKYEKLAADYAASALQTFQEMTAAGHSMKDSHVHEAMLSLVASLTSLSQIGRIKEAVSILDTIYFDRKDFFYYFFRGHFNSQIDPKAAIADYNNALSNLTRDYKKLSSLSKLLLRLYFRMYTDLSVAAREKYYRILVKESPGALEKMLEKYQEIPSPKAFEANILSKREALLRQQATDDAVSPRPSASVSSTETDDTPSSPSTTTEVQDSSARRTSSSLSRTSVSQIQMWQSPKDSLSSNSSNSEINSTHSDLSNDSNSPKSP